MSLHSYSLMQDMQAIHHLGTHTAIAGVEIDSRRLHSNFAFFCLRGSNDGHLFIPHALEAGAKVNAPVLLLYAKVPPPLALAVVTLKSVNATPPDCATQA